jgi:hypothetical protein
VGAASRRPHPVRVRLALGQDLEVDSDLLARHHVRKRERIGLAGRIGVAILTLAAVPLELQCAVLLHDPILGIDVGVVQSRAALGRALEGRVKPLELVGASRCETAGLDSQNTAVGAVLGDFDLWRSRGRSRVRDFAASASESHTGYCGCGEHPSRKQNGAS